MDDGMQALSVIVRLFVVLIVGKQAIIGAKKSDRAIAR
jgi:hypothetical protein